MTWSTTEPTTSTVPVVATAVPAVGARHPLAVGRQMGPIGKDRSPASVLGFTILTLGLYYIYWYAKINGEIRRHDPNIRVRPFWALVALFVPIASTISAYCTAARIRQMQLDEGQTQTISPVVALLLHLFLGIGYPLYIASQLREHWHGHSVRGFSA